MAGPDKAPAKLSSDQKAASSSKSAPAKKASNRPSAEEIEAKRRQRAEKKQRDAEEKERQAQLGIAGVGKDGKVPFQTRQWSSVRGVATADSDEGRTVRILSWNILAQGLVRRKLFPGSDCLKWKEREEGLTAEMVSHNWDVGAFQEVDRIDVHGPNLEKSGRSYVYAKGYEGKQHGLLIAWRTDARQAAKGTLFHKDAAASKMIFFDREHVDTQTTRPGTRRALSRVTRNVGLLVALRFQDAPPSKPRGIIIGTTHLFWHPMHGYERVRQMGIMKRRMVDWRNEHEELADWPMFLAGDFNDQPHSATYKLVVGEAMTQHCFDEVRQSSVVHMSVDALRDKGVEEPGEAVQQASSTAQQTYSNGHVAKPNEANDEDDEEAAAEDDEEEGEDDQVLKNCRVATKEDGLLSFEELMQLHDLSRPPPASDVTVAEPGELIGKRAGLGITSLYGQNFHKLETDQQDNFFGSPSRGRERYDDPDWTPDTPNPHLHSSYEPMYTLYSSLFCLTLDYIFLFPPRGGSGGAAPTVTGLLPTHTTDVLQPGVPRRNVCASDHVAIGAEVVL